MSEQQNDQLVEHPLKGRFDLSRAEWLTPSGGGTVQVAFVDDLIGMRNAEDPEGPVLLFTQDEWDAFVLGAKDGEFDPETFDEAEPLHENAEPAEEGNEDTIDLGERARSAQARELLEEGE